jgi:hypothetical protein
MLNPKYLLSLALLSTGAALSLGGSFGSFYDVVETKICTPVVGCKQRSIPAWISSDGETIREGEGARMLGLSFAGFTFTGGAIWLLIQTRQEEWEWRLEESERQRQINQGDRLAKQQQAQWAEMALEVERHKAQRWAAEQILPLQQIDWDEPEDKPFPALTGTQTLDQTNDPKDKMEGREDKALAEGKPKAPELAGAPLSELPSFPGIKFFNWKWFQEKPNEFPHVRAVGATGSGKTWLADWLMDVFPSGERLVVTVKRKQNQWQGLPVYGVPENYDSIHSKLEWLEKERRSRIADLEEGKEHPFITAVIDEWKAINSNCPVERDPKTKQIVRRSAKQIVNATITLAREANIRLIALAQGRQVKTWGFEDESDLLDCFVTIYLGKFALRECEKTRNRFQKESPEFQVWDSVLTFLKSQGKRAAWVEAEVGTYPAVVPDLSKWKRPIDTKKPSASPVTETNSLRERLEFCLENSPSGVSSEEPNKLVDTDNEEAIEELFDWANGKGWLKISEVTAKCKRLRKFNVSTDKVRELIARLEQERRAHTNAKDEFAVGDF